MAAAVVVLLGGSAAGQPAAESGGELRVDATSESASGRVPPSAAGSPAAAAKRRAVKPAPAQPPLAASEQRPVPDYSGRGSEPLTAGEVLIWVPRVLLMPMYLVSEYLIRWPIGKLTSALDHNDIPDVLADFFTFGPGDRTGLVPSGLIDFGFRPSIGLYFFSDDVLWPGNSLRSHLAFGGPDWYRATATVRQTLEQPGVGRYQKSFELRGAFSHRPDWLYYGGGPLSSSDHAGRYTAQRIEGTLRYHGGWWRSSQLDSFAGVRDLRFDDSGCCGDATVGEAVAAGHYPRPQLFDDGYTVARAGLDLSLDSRRRRNIFEGEGSDHVSPSGSGFELGVRGELGAGLRGTQPVVPTGPTRLSYARYGATLGGFFDLYHQRVVGLQLVADFVDPLIGGGQLPFTELASLGGSRPLRGFLPGRLLGRSAAAAVLEYRWPIWVYLDGTAHYAIGNVFGEHLAGLKAGLLRQSFGIGFRGIGSRDHAFEMLVAAGSNTFDDGAAIDSVRFVLGASSGY